MKEQKTLVDEICPRCGAAMQANHHELCQKRDGTPTPFPDNVVRWCIENGYTLVAKPTDDVVK
jgi:hypothetical protein